MIAEKKHFRTLPCCGLWYSRNLEKSWALLFHKGQCRQAKEERCVSFWSVAGVITVKESRFLGRPNEVLLCVHLQSQLSWFVLQMEATTFLYRSESSLS